MGNAKARSRCLRFGVKQSKDPILFSLRRERPLLTHIYSIHILVLEFTSGALFEVVTVGRFWDRVCVCNKHIVSSRIFACLLEINALTVFLCYHQSVVLCPKRTSRKSVAVLNQFCVFSAQCQILWKKWLIKASRQRYQSGRPWIKRSPVFFFRAVLQGSCV